MTKVQRMQLLLVAVAWVALWIAVLVQPLDVPFGHDVAVWMALNWVAAFCMGVLVESHQR